MQRSTVVLLVVTVLAWLGVAVLALLLTWYGGPPPVEPVRLG